MTPARATRAGPIAVRDQAGAWRQIGIVSYGEGCGKAKLARRLRARRQRADPQLHRRTSLRIRAAGPGARPARARARRPATPPRRALSMTMTPALVPGRRDHHRALHARRGGDDQDRRPAQGPPRRQAPARPPPGLIERRAHAGIAELRFRPRKVKRGATYYLAIQAVDASGNRTPILGAKFRVT